MNRGLPFDCGLSVAAAAPSSPEDAWETTVDLVLGLLHQYLQEALDDCPEELTADTTFMDAGLDSLDLLKVSHLLPRHRCCVDVNLGVVFMQKRLETMNPTALMMVASWLKVLQHQGPRMCC